MKRISRAVHIDFHNMPGIVDFGAELNPGKIARMLGDAGVTWVNLFAQCNIGFSYYPTKLGTPYPSMCGDLFGDLVREFHAAGIKTAAYINAGVNHELARKHYDWCRLDAEGRVIRGDRTDNFSRTMCYNREGYQRYLLGIAEEVLQYDIDGLFVDCMFSMPCWCDKCTEDMLRRGIDLCDEAAVSSFAFEKTLDFAKVLRSALPHGCCFYVNGLPFDRLQGAESHIELECLPGSGWGYDYFIPMASYARKINPNVVYMTGRFQMGWGDFGGYKSRASIENDVYDALCQNCGVSIGDHMHPVKGLDAALYRMVGEVYRSVAQYEPWAENTKFIAEIGILRNRSDSRISLLSGSLQGAARMLSELKYCFDILNEEMDFTPYRLLILPDGLEMNEKTIEKLRRFLRAGGAVLGSGSAGVDEETDFFILPEFGFLSVEGRESTPGYFRMADEGKETPYLAMYEPGLLMRAGEGSTVLAGQAPAYFDKRWDGLHGYFYTPPKQSGEFCAAAVKGNAAQISFPVFLAYFLYGYVRQKELAEDVIRRLLPRPLIRAKELPASARTTLTGNGKHTLLHIKITRPELRGRANVIEEHDVLPKGRRISVRGSFGGAYLLPGKTELQMQEMDGYTEITLPEITGYAMILLK